MSARDSILDMFSPEVASEVASAASFAEAISTLNDSDPSALAALSAVNTLASQALQEGNWFAKPVLNAAGAALSIAALAESLNDGEFTVDDVAAASAAISSVLSRVKHPATQAAAAYFGLYSIAVPWLTEKGAELGRSLPWFLDNFDFGEFWGHLSDDIQDLFSDSQSLPPAYSDPLALDLDGDGIETVGVGDWQNTVLFDHDGNGVREGTGWLSGDDGWLVRDLNANGTIDTGAELFGDNTILGNGTTAAEGFSALADLDSNADGVIDASDAAFGELQVWQDRNQDGFSQA